MDFPKSAGLFLIVALSRPSPAGVYPELVDSSRDGLSRGTLRPSNAGLEGSPVHRELRERLPVSAGLEEVKQWDGRDFQRKVMGFEEKRRRGEFTSFKVLMEWLHTEIKGGWSWFSAFLEWAESPEWGTLQVWLQRTLLEVFVDQSRRWKQGDSARTWRIFEQEASHPRRDPSVRSVAILGMARLGQTSEEQAKALKAIQQFLSFLKNRLAYKLELERIGKALSEIATRPAIELLVQLAEQHRYTPPISNVKSRWEAEKRVVTLTWQGREFELRSTTTPSWYGPDHQNLKTLSKPLGYSPDLLKEFSQFPAAWKNLASSLPDQHPLRRAMARSSSTGLEEHLDPERARRLYGRVHKILSGEDRISDFLWADEASFLGVSSGGFYRGSMEWEGRTGVSRETAKRIKTIIQRAERRARDYRSGERTLRTLPRLARIILHYYGMVGSKNFRKFPAVKERHLVSFFQQFWDAKLKGISPENRRILREKIQQSKGYGMAAVVLRITPVPSGEVFEKAFDDLEAVIQNPQYESLLATGPSAPSTDSGVDPLSGSPPRDREGIVSGSSVRLPPILKQGKAYSGEGYWKVEDYYELADLLEEYGGLPLEQPDGSPRKLRSIENYQELDGLYELSGDLQKVVDEGRLQLQKLTSEGISPDTLYAALSKEIRWASRFTVPKMSRQRYFTIRVKLDAGVVSYRGQEGLTELAREEQLSPVTIWMTFGKKYGKALGWKRPPPPHKRNAGPPSSGLEEMVSRVRVRAQTAREAVIPLRFLADTKLGQDPRVLHLLQWAVLLNLREGVPIRVAAVATEEELDRAKAQMPLFAHDLLEDLVVPYDPKEEASYRFARAVAEMMIPDFHPDFVMTTVDSSKVGWFFDELIRLGIQDFSQELRDRIETFLYSV